MTKTARSNLREFLRDLAGRLSSHAWTWDPRFGCVLCELKTPECREESLATLRDLFDEDWDAANIADAPDGVQGLRQRLGGVMYGQILFAALDEDAELAFCAWWPWGDGHTVSVRIGCSCAMIDDIPAEAALREAFGVR